jgi:16S rRNA (cytosine967-C5)-methyltransferase
LTPGSASPASQPLALLLEHAACSVAAVRTGQSLTEVLDALPAPVRPGAQALAFHALRHMGWAESVRARLVPRRPPPAVDALLLCALSLLAGGGDEAPSYAPHTVVDQAVRCAKRMASAQAALVNAVLRRALREAEALAVPPPGDVPARWNHPAWWVDRLRADWPQHWEALLAASNRRAPMSLRVNARRGDAAWYLARLREAGLAARAVGSHAVVLDEPQPVTRLPGFAQGDVSVQDLSAQLAAPLLLQHPLAPGARVLDACAAPGGKTAHLLERAELELQALDVDAKRLQRVGDNLQRLGLQAQLAAADAARPHDWWDGRPFDAILLDAPCSASGIGRRHPDVRWLRRAADIPALARTQDGLLDALWPLLKPGGRMVYATCSVFAAEGRERVDAFSQRAADARVGPAPGHVLGVADNPATAGLLGPAPAPPDAVSPFHAASPASLFDGFFYAVFDKPPS